MASAEFNNIHMKGVVCFHAELLETPLAARVYNDP
jgi:hypothetical protein